MKACRLAFFGVLLLTQSCFSSPTSNSKLLINDHEFNEENQFYRVTLKNFIERLMPFCERYIDLLEKTVEDLKINKKAIEYEHVKKQLDLVSKHSEHIKSSNYSEAFKGFLNFERSISGHGKNVDDVFLKHDGEDLVEEFCQSLLKYFNDFLNSFIAYANGLKEEEKAANNNFLEWFKSFRDEEDCGDKFEKFKKFFKFFNPQLFAVEN
uniref:Uncharacterized protein n=1 Tax=Glossina brevipalpis TaxID=37001 RepID=A0A1A9W3W5_9MUSC